LRNGANQLYHHPLLKSWRHSDAVGDCWQAGYYWLMAILATELRQWMKSQKDLFQGTLTVFVSGNQKATLQALGSDGEGPSWTRDGEYTDMPEGNWMFYIANEGERFVTILPSEY
jgi:hypothetical protein